MMTMYARAGAVETVPATRLGFTYKILLLAESYHGLKGELQDASII
ncbi:MAG: hypothetical protein LBS19_00460 [Clostridiales bacterium]|nr:hypothetical protein [Clostridiales bacterium]